MSSTDDGCRSPEPDGAGQTASHGVHYVLDRNGVSIRKSAFWAGAQIPPPPLEELDIEDARPDPTQPSKEVGKGTPIRISWWRASIRPGRTFPPRVVQRGGHRQLREAAARIPVGPLTPLSSGLLPQSSLVSRDPLADCPARFDCEVEEQERITSVSVRVMQRLVSVTRLFNRHQGEILLFFTEAMTADAVAPGAGSRSLADYFKELTVAG